MRITIDTDILSKNNLSMGEFLTLLLGFWNLNFYNCLDDLLKKKLVDESETDHDGIILSNNTKNLVSRVLTESDNKLLKCPIKDFGALAKTLMEIYPKGIKQGTTYPWQGTVEEVAQKLRVLVVRYGFEFTEQEAINATKEYVDSYKDDTTKMRLLKYFILRTYFDNKKNSHFSAFDSTFHNTRGAVSDHSSPLKCLASSCAHLGVFRYLFVTLTSECRAWSLATTIPSALARSLIPESFRL